MTDKSEHNQSTNPHAILSSDRDRIFAESEGESFGFGKEVANVFDDMVSRSVPCYLDIQLLASSVAARFYQEGTAIYDLGCSTGTTLALIAKRLPQQTEIYGIDSSQSMIAKAEEKLGRLKLLDQITLYCERLQDIALKRSSVITSYYTLQFLPEIDREEILEKIFTALIPGGAFLFSEKTEPAASGEDKKLITELHEDFKQQNGYSESEVARKRESLKGFMRPFSEELNRALLKRIGFTSITEVIRGYSFVTWLCLKK